MPWEIKRDGDEYCVYKEGDSEPVPGGCHDTRNEAEAHLRALYASENVLRVTDFPSDGEDLKISLRNSQYPQFDYDYALDLKENYPDIWDAGGNVRGDEAFVLWGRAREGSETEAVLAWIKEREAWAARHEENFRLAGVVAQIKWGVIGSRGEGYMKDLVNEEKQDQEKSLGGDAMPEKLQRFIPIIKVDAVKREVWGVAAEEAPDKAGEIMDYERSKPHFKEWSDGIYKASGGKSYGNLRAMHANIAAGKLISLEMRDEEKQIYIGAKVVDDAEWNKVVEGVYTGFSMGGSYGEIWEDPDNAEFIRYEAVPSEISLADNPCMYGTVFELVRASGSTMHKFVGGAVEKMDLERYVLQIKQSWWRQFGPDIEEGDYSPVYIEAVHDDKIIISNEADELTAYPYTANEGGEIAFGEPQRVEIQYVPMAAPIPGGEEDEGEVEEMEGEPMDEMEGEPPDEEDLVMTLTRMLTDQNISTTSSHSRPVEYGFLSGPTVLAEDPRLVQRIIDLRQIVEPTLGKVEKQTAQIQEATAAIVKLQAQIADLEARLAKIEAEPVGEPPALRQVPPVPEQKTATGGMLEDIAELRRMVATEPDPRIRANYQRRLIIAEAAQAASRQ